MTAFSKFHKIRCVTLSWLILALLALQYLAVDAMALPTVTETLHLTDRFGPNTVPFLPVGDKVQIFVLIDSVDPIGSPTISVEAHQGSTTLALDPLPPGSPLFEGLHGYYKFIDFNPAITGAWQITPH